ncbi:hypothetical protein [Streptomyces sp. NPDC091278]|uniref:hypothetical protein n=1 Tax=Streptomyces sp. NPDC091278 TaxID=3155301 RepID=UPI0034508D12
MNGAGGIPGAWLTGSGDHAPTITVTLYDAAGDPLTETTGLAEIRSLIADDRVPIPVNDAARGSIEYDHAEEASP